MYRYVILDELDHFVGKLAKNICTYFLVKKFKLQFKLRIHITVYKQQMFC
jgi:hypothetical protein